MMENNQTTQSTEKTSLKQIHLPEEVSVRTLSSLLGVDPTSVIGKLAKGGVMANINQNIDIDTATLLAEEYGFEVLPEEKKINVDKGTTGKNAIARPPIVTIMGHVDHGKTSLLDYIRRSNVAAGETGGITQHISAYQIEFTTKDKEKRKITFVDTPGHEAFSALRAHGAALTDIVILVVAADDGVKPQTIEAIDHARKNNVQIIIAINKTDAPGANIERVKQQLSDQQLVAEEWGGQAVIVPISAKTGEGVDTLLEMVVLAADLMELKADPEVTPEGIVIEGRLDKQIGPLATVIIYNGTLRNGQVVVVGQTFGRIRALEDDTGAKIASAGPAKPVRLVGLKDAPKFGDRLEVVPNEKVARSMTQHSVKSRTGAAEDANTIRIVLKADVGGSLAALEDSIRKLKFKDATVDILATGIGQVNENDINMAKASNGVIISFRTPPTKRVSELAEKEGVELKEYGIIYEALEYLQSEIKRIATPVYVTVEVARLKVLAIFSAKGSQAIVGGEVSEGVVSKDKEVAVMRSKEEVAKGKLTGVKIGKVDVDKAEKGEQCGLSLENLSAPVEVGDVLVLTETKEE